MRRMIWKGLGSPRDDIQEPAVQAVATSPRQPLLDWLIVEIFFSWNNFRKLMLIKEIYKK
jgi:hypothetical protein